MAENHREQHDELLALSSILESEMLVTSKTGDGRNFVKLIAHLDSSDSLEIIVSDAENKNCKSAMLRHLPPIHVNIDMPVDYPSDSTPNVSVAACWLDTCLTNLILGRLAEISAENPGLPVLYSYYQFVKDELWHLLPNPLDLNRLFPLFPNKGRKNSRISHRTDKNGKTNNKWDAKRSNVQSADQLFRSLVDYDSFKRKQKFDKSTFSCQICLLDNYGSNGLLFHPCQHVFCKPCCKQFFELHIKDGTLDLLKCLAEKCQSLAHPDLIEQVVEAQLFQRYDRLALTRSLDLMQDVVICPRPTCAIFVVKDDQYNNMAVCPQCYFAFCTLCKKVYHGVAPCSFTNADVTAIVEEYSAGDEETKAKLESKYGQNTVRRLVEDASSTKWMMDNCKQCPTCRSFIERKDGCNKMWCSKCGGYFCWLCMKKLNVDDPYSHFNDPDSACFNLLFRGVVMDDDSENDDD